ncbi:Protein N-acetyltransferase, RimJ/RimL family [Microbacterium testaceum StLB037]|uniref:Protein N-acetyltransferase, RimJ/RimL family n=1 Tax=Microbacterium testaceum (strain StLB037) TaxID=979556 RepID=A0A1H0R291_MICTS|nr:GNAT family protein [Microbacterium testaceum]SDP23651.1 Protein N-acetyltransferase, RimJ/RimL family [Microbacterium testaceum StLB037]
MILHSARVALEPISQELARRIVDRQEQPGDNWHPEYPFADELVPLAALSAAEPTNSPFTMYLVRRTDDGRAIGGFGFFGPPDELGHVEFGYGLVPSARGAGLATEAVGLALRFASAWGARVAAADTDVRNIASQQVLLKNGFSEIRRDDALVYYRRRFGAERLA